MEAVSGLVFEDNLAMFLKGRDILEVFPDDDKYIHTVRVHYSGEPIRIFIKHGDGPEKSTFKLRDNY